MRWTRRRRLAGGADADGKVVWSCPPDAGVKLACDSGPATEATKPGLRRSPGRARISRNTIAQGMPDRSGEPVVTNSRVFVFHARLRVHLAPGIPRSL